MQERDLKGKAAISGLGITEQGRVYGHDAAWFAAEAIRLAVQAAGLRKDEIDGLLVNHGVAPMAGGGGGAAFGGSRLGDAPRGMRGLSTAFGVFGANARYALAARRHMGLYGTTNDHFGAIAVAQRRWAVMNPLAQQRDPIT